MLRLAVLPGVAVGNEPRSDCVDVRPGGVGALAPGVKALIASAINAEHLAIAPGLYHATWQSYCPAAAGTPVGVFMLYFLLAYFTPWPVHPWVFQGGSSLGLTLGFLPFPALQAHAPVELVHTFVTRIRQRILVSFALCSADYAPAPFICSGPFREVRLNAWPKVPMLSRRKVCP